MLIDWFTVGAQTLNFIILVWLLKRFLYQPILNAIDAREKKIARELAQADAVSQEANQASAEFEQKNYELEQHRETIMREATVAADKESQRLLECAHIAAFDLGARREQALENKLHQLHESIRDVVQHEVFAMTKNALRDLADSNVEDQMINLFIQRLSDLTPKQLASFQTAIESKPTSATDSTKLPNLIPMTVLSSVAVPSKQQAVITKLLKELLGNNIQINFDLSPELIGGISLDAQGFKIAWSIAEYLHSMESALNELVEKNSFVVEKNNANDQKNIDVKNNIEKNNSISNTDTSSDEDSTSVKDTSPAKQSPQKKYKKKEQLKSKTSQTLHSLVADDSSEESPILTRYESEHNTKDSST